MHSAEHARLAPAQQASAAEIGKPLKLFHPENLKSLSVRDTVTISGLVECATKKEANTVSKHA